MAEPARRVHARPFERNRTAIAAALAALAVLLLALLAYCSWGRPGGDSAAPGLAAPSTAAPSDGGARRWRHEVGDAATGDAATGQDYGVFVQHGMSWAPNTFLGSLAPATAAEAVDLSVRRQFAPGRIVLREGAEDDHVELLLSGFVKVTTSVEGVETLLSIRVAGEVVGEIGALTGQPRSATVTACGRVVAGVIGRAEFEAFLRRHPEAALRVTATVADQLRWANRRRTDFAVYPAHVRLARLLVEIAEVTGRTNAAGEVEIGVPLSQPELATMIAIAQATVQKAIQELRGQGLISTGYRRMTVLDMAALRALAEIP